jgi:hypothetical protein
VRLILTTPLLRAEFFKTIIARDNALADAIAERVGSPSGDLFPQILAAAYSSATRVVTHRWLHDDDVDFFAVLREAMGMVAPMAAARDTHGQTVHDQAVQAQGQTVNGTRTKDTASRPGSRRAEAARSGHAA